MPEQAVGQPGGAGTAGGGGAAPAGMPPAAPPAAAPPGKAPVPPAAPGTAPPAGSLAGAQGGDVQARVAELERRLTDQGRQFKTTQEALKRAETIFGPQDAWAQHGAEAAAQPAPQAPPAPAPRTAAAVNWEAWATDTYQKLSQGQWVPEGIDPRTGDVVPAHHVPGDPAMAREFATRQDSVLRGMGIVPPWEGLYGLGAGQQARPRAGQGSDEDRPLTMAEYRKLRDQEALAQMDAEEQYDAQLAALRTQRRIGDDFLRAVVEIDGRPLSRERHIERYAAQNGVSIESAAIALFQGDLMSYWQQAAYAAGQGQAQTDQLATGPGAPVRTAPFPTPPPTEQEAAAFAAADHSSGVPSGIGMKPPPEQAETVYGSPFGRGPTP